MGKEGKNSRGERRTHQQSNARMGGKKGKKPVKDLRGYAFAANVLKKDEPKVIKKYKKKTKIETKNGILILYVKPKDEEAAQPKYVIYSFFFHIS